MFDRLAKQLKKAKQSKLAKRNLRRGKGFEYEVKDWFLTTCSVIVKKARRIPISGGGSDKGDVEITLENDTKFRVECKRRKDAFKQIYDWLEKEGTSFLIVRSDYKSKLIIFDEHSFLDFFQQVFEIGYQHGKKESR